MNYPSIRIENAILTPNILERIEESTGQRTADFGLDPGAQVKDEVARAWADAEDYWRIFQRKVDGLREGATATTATRNLWMTPLLGLLGYQLQYHARGKVINEKNYAISHRVMDRGETPIHIIGYLDPAGVDRKPENATRRMSAHGLVQEYLNLTEQLYGLVTNGRRVLRLLRDSSRRVQLTYLEFDLDRIFNRQPLCRLCPPLPTNPRNSAADNQRSCSRVHSGAFPSGLTGFGWGCWRPSNSLRPTDRAKNQDCHLWRVLSLFLLPLVRSAKPC